MYRKAYNNLTSLADQIREQATSTDKTTTSQQFRRPRGLMNAKQISYIPEEQPKTQQEVLADYLAEFGSDGLPDDFVEVIQAGPDTPRPAYRSYVDGQRGLEADQEFMSELNRLKERFPGLTDRELFLVIQGESNFNPQASNDSGARGLFQITPVAAKEAGIDYERILDMSPAEQLREYEKYLDRWEYTGSHSLGVLQGAPGYRNADEGTVVYEVGSAAWEQNPGWRSGRNGPVTVGSIDAYYRRR